MTVQPVDRSRTGRIVNAILNGDNTTAQAVVQEAIADDRVLELHDATLGALISFLWLTAGIDGAKQWASDWILKARLETETTQMNNRISPEGK